MYLSLWDVTISHKLVTQCKSHCYIGAWCCVHWGMWGMGLTRGAVWLVTWGIVLTWEIEVKKLWLTCDLFTSNQPASAYSNYSMNGTSTPVQCVQYLCKSQFVHLGLASEFGLKLLNQPEIPLCSNGKCPVLNWQFSQFKLLRDILLQTLSLCVH